MNMRTPRTSERNAKLFHTLYWIIHCKSIIVFCTESCGMCVVPLSLLLNVCFCTTITVGYAVESLRLSLIYPFQNVPRRGWPFLQELGNVQ